MKNEIASPCRTPSSRRKTPAGLSHGPQITPHTLSPSRSFSVPFCCATRPGATHRPSSAGVFGAGVEVTAATSEPSPSTRVNASVAAVAGSPPTIENDTCPLSITLPSATRNTVDGSSQGPQTTPVNVLPCVLKTYVFAERPVPDI